MIDDNFRGSFTAASSFPVKVLRQMKNCFCDTPNGKYGILPIHVQFCPTNRCDSACSFCSCSNRERNAEMSKEQMLEISHDLSVIGTKAVTITGGGEPLLFPHLSEFIQTLSFYDMASGLTTNGNSLYHHKHDLNGLKWCRISLGDHKDIAPFLASLISTIKEYPQIDWAFSYILSPNPDIDKLVQTVDFANTYNFTHVRVSHDLLDLKHATNMNKLKEVLSMRVQDNKVIYQDRQQFVRGKKRCLIGLLKPLIAPDGFIYPCCGVQYAINGIEGNFPDCMRLEKASKIIEWSKSQIPFDGSVCDKCYYNDYNLLLERIIDPLSHEFFV